MVEVPEVSEPVGIAGASEPESRKALSQTTLEIYTVVLVVVVIVADVGDDADQG